MEGKELGNAAAREVDAWNGTGRPGIDMIAHHITSSRLCCSCVRSCTCTYISHPSEQGYLSCIKEGNKEGGWQSNPLYTTMDISFTTTPHHTAQRPLSQEQRMNTLYCPYPTLLYWTILPSYIPSHSPHNHQVHQPANPLRLVSHKLTNATCHAPHKHEQLPTSTHQRKSHKTNSQATPNKRPPAHHTQISDAIPRQLHPKTTRMLTTTNAAPPKTI